MRRACLVRVLMILFIIPSIWTSELRVIGKYLVNLSGGVYKTFEKTNLNRSFDVACHVLTLSDKSGITHVT